MVLFLPLNTISLSHSHTPPHCLTDLLLTREDKCLWFSLIPFRFTCLLFVLIVTCLPAIMLTLVQQWQKQSRWVGLTSIFWWLTFLRAIWVEGDSAHCPENCRMLKLTPLFSLYLIYLLLFGNRWNKLLLSLIIASTHRGVWKSKYPIPCGWGWGHTSSWIWDLLSHYVQGLQVVFEVPLADLWKFGSLFHMHFFHHDSWHI